MSVAFRSVRGCTLVIAICAGAIPLERPVGAVTLDLITVGTAGNSADTTLQNDGTSGYGAVGYLYRIATTEVTNGQYAEFLNAVAATDDNALYDSQMSSNPRGGITQSGSSGSFSYATKANMGDKPVLFVTFHDALRFANWLHNGQPSGAQGPSTTEDGAYTITTEGVANNTIVRNANADFFLPDEHEWYKAAYHEPGASGDDYWSFATRSDGSPTGATADATGAVSNPGVNVANYDRFADWNGLNGNVTTVGSAGPTSKSYHGTFDQSGNVWEWNETMINTSLRGVRGGCWLCSTSTFLQSTYRSFGKTPDTVDDIIGFRLASRTVAGDVDDNGEVDFQDFLDLQIGFGISSGARRSDGDLDDDGDVDFSGLLGPANQFW